MRILSTQETNSVSAAYAAMSGGFSAGPNNMSFKPGFYIEVTNSSSNVLYNFACYSNKVMNLSTNEILFNGSQSNFCFNGSSFQVSPVEGGHRYTYTGNC